MITKKLALAGLFAAVSIPLAHVCVAEIYESKDSAGNPVFSDTPTTGAEEVNLQKGNIAEPPPDMPESSREGAPESVAEDAGEDGGAVFVIPDSRNDELEDRLERERRREVRDADVRREVGDAEPRHEVRDAQERHEVRDAEERHEVRDAEARHQVQDASPRHGVPGGGRGR